MPRPRCCRRVEGEPADCLFKPAKTPGRDLERIVMTLDEYEALRLSDGEGLYQEDAASRMGVSRATFGRILETAHAKVAQALIGGKALAIQGGPVRLVGHQDGCSTRCRRRGNRANIKNQQES